MKLVVDTSRTTRSPADPAEPWEIPVAKKDRSRVESQLPGRPFKPTRADEVPSRSLSGLESPCGRVPLERLFVLPAATRLVNPTSCVVTPGMVLAFGDRALGLWIDDGPAGRTLSVPIDRLLAVEDRLILLYGRLRFVAGDRQIVVRYNTVAREYIGDNVESLRRRVARTAFPVEPAFVWKAPHGAGTRPADLPFKWRIVLDKPAVRPDEGPAAIAVGDVSPLRPAPGRPASGVAVLGPRELVIANEPTEYTDRARYGVDVLSVPRTRLDALRWDGCRVEVHLDGRPEDAGAAPVSLALDPNLVDAMRSAFGAQIRWR
jgi:hypothetical protein